MSLSLTSLSSRGSSESELGEWLPTDQRFEDIQTKYEHMVQEISEHFHKKVTREMLMKKLRLAPPELKHLSTYVRLRDSADDVDIFTEVVKSSDFRYLPLLVQLVHDLGNDVCKRAMALYQEDLANFNTDTSLRAYARVTGISPEDREGAVLTMGAKWKRRSLWNFEEFLVELSKKAQFNPHDLQLRGAKLPCLQLALVSVSNSADISNLRRVGAQFFKQNRVLLVRIGDETLYHVESPKVCFHIHIP